MAEQKQIQKKIYVFVFINLRGKFILCYFAYAYVASENQALSGFCYLRESCIRADIWHYYQYNTNISYTKTL